MPLNDQPREFTPDELRAIYARFKKQFTVEDFIEYVEDDRPKIPLADVIAEGEAMLREWESEEKPA